MAKKRGEGAPQPLTPAQEEAADGSTATAIAYYIICLLQKSMEVAVLAPGWYAPPLDDTQPGAGARLGPDTPFGRNSRVQLMMTVIIGYEIYNCIYEFVRAGRINEHFAHHIMAGLTGHAALQAFGQCVPPLALFLALGMDGWLKWLTTAVLMAAGRFYAGFFFGMCSWTSVFLVPMDIMDTMPKLKDTYPLTAVIAQGLFAACFLGTRTFWWVMVSANWWQDTIFVCWAQDEGHACKWPMCMMGTANIGLTLLQVARNRRYGACMRVEARVWSISYRVGCPSLSCCLVVVLTRCYGR